LVPLRLRFPARPDIESDTKVAGEFTVQSSEYQTGSERTFGRLSQRRYVRHSGIRFAKRERLSTVASLARHQQPDPHFDFILSNHLANDVTGFCRRSQRVRACSE